jgi:hypothetical protein
VLPLKPIDEDDRAGYFKSLKNDYKKQEKLQPDLL